MFLKRLYLNSFRNYEQIEVHFSPGVNLIYGENAQGKTNLLEAIYLLSTGRSFRTTKFAELIQEGKKGFYIEAEFEKEGINQHASIGYDGTKRLVTINNTRHNFFSALLGLLPTVLFAPGDIALLSGSPTDRRHFLDLHIAQFDPFYVHHMTRYYKAMKQRSHLLKLRSNDTVALWEQMMATSGAYVIQKRHNAIEELKLPILHYGQILSEKKDQIGLEYNSPLRSKKDEGDLTEYLLTQFKKHREKDQLYGHALFGPHKDDLLLSINEQNAKAFSSEGQKRSCITAMRFAQWQRLKEQTALSPIMSIDDFGVHLDSLRMKQLETHLGSFGQTFLTSPHSFQTAASSAHLFQIEKGKLLC